MSIAHKLCKPVGFPFVLPYFCLPLNKLLLKVKLQQLRLAKTRSKTFSLSKSDYYVLEYIYISKVG